MTDTIDDGVRADIKARVVHNVREGLLDTMLYGEAFLDAATGDHIPHPSRTQPVLGVVSGGIPNGRGGLMFLPDPDAPVGTASAVTAADLEAAGWKELGYTVDTGAFAFTPDPPAGDDGIDDYGMSTTVRMPVAGTAGTVTFTITEPDPGVLAAMYGDLTAAMSIADDDWDGVLRPAKPTLRQRLRCWLHTGHDWNCSNGPHGWEHQRCTYCKAERFID